MYAVVNTSVETMFFRGAYNYASKRNGEEQMRFVRIRPARKYFIGCHGRKMMFDPPKPVCTLVTNRDYKEILLKSKEYAVLRDDGVLRGYEVCGKGLVK